MRTTINIDDDLLETLKKRAAEESRSLQDVTNEVLRHGLAERAQSAYECSLGQAWKARQRASVDLFDRDRLLDLLDEDE